MEINTEYITVEKTARISTYGTLGPNTKYFWMVLHGSRMLCEQVLYKFENFDPDTHFVIAPEALLRFYGEGFGGDVVASWMTKRDRLHEISDISDYLTNTYSRYMDQLPSDCKRILMGFSQGGTMAYRWLHSKQIAFDAFIPYASWIPEEIDLKASRTDLNAIKTIFTYGREDQFISENTVAKIQDVITRNNLNLSITSFDGDHRIVKSHLEELFEMLDL